MDVMQLINDNEAIVVMIITGLVAGFIASLLVGGGGLLRNLIIGLIGAVVGGFLVTQGILSLPYDFNTLIPTYGNQIVVSTIGAVLVVLLARILIR